MDWQENTCSRTQTTDCEEMREECFSMNHGVIYHRDIGYGCGSKLWHSGEHV